MAPLPLVVAGPIVRRVEAREVSVWVALSRQAQVTLSVFPGSQMAGASAGTTAPATAALGTQTTPTKRFGTNLHVAVVTLELSGGAVLTPGSIHSYDLGFSGDFGSSGLKQEGLLRDETSGTRITDVHADAPLHLALGYVTDRLPSFVAPAATIDRLVLAHASCRKPHGPAEDAMTFLDDELASDYLDTDKRVQQLVLTGDQVYADDVASVLLDMLSGLAQDLVGTERVEVADGVQVDVTMDNMPATRRQRLVQKQAGFTTGSGSDHLVSFGEFAAMYCAVWSSRAWRALRPTNQVVRAIPSSAASGVKPHLSDHEACAAKDPKATFPDSWNRRTDSQRARVEAFRDTVARTARVLANTSTAMIFDDHEVTDDWNLNASWVNRVRARPLGRNIVRNGVMAYLVFQGWGNEPKRYANTDSDNKEHKLLEEVRKGFDGTGPFPLAAMDVDEVNKLVGVTNEAGKTARFHYAIDGPRHKLVVLDTRTKRDLPGQGLHPPKLLGGTLDKQVPKGPFTDGRELIVLVSPVPVLGPPLIDSIGASIARIVQDSIHGVRELLSAADEDCPPSGSQWGAEKYEAEAWNNDEEGLEKLLARLAPYTRAIVLSGDVHYGCTMTLDYFRKDRTTPDRIVQLTSSPASNRFKALVEEINRESALPQAYLRGMRPERLGWNGEAKITVPSGQSIAPGRRARMKAKPALLPTRTWPNGTTVDTAPDWTWRLELVRDERPDSGPSSRPPGLAPPSLGAFQAGDPIATYREAAARHQLAALQRLDHVRTVVFTPNVGVVEFAETGGRLSVTHSLLSKVGTADPARNTVHVAELEPQGITVPELVTEV